MAWIIALVALIVLLLVLVFFLIMKRRKVALTPASIQQEIDKVSAAGGGTVFVPAGEYILEQPLVLQSNVHLKGEGIGETVFRIKAKLPDGSSAGFHMLTAERAQNVKVSRMTLDGQNSQRPDKINDPFAHTLSLAWVKGFEIFDIEAINSAGGSIVLYNVNDGSVHDTFITNSGSNAILGLQRNDNVQVVRNTVQKTLNQNGIYFMFQDEKQSTNITIDGNTVREAADYGIEVGHTIQTPTSPPHRHIFARNNVVEHSYCTGIGFRSVSDGVIENNTIRGYAKNDLYGCNGIFVEGRASLHHDVAVRNNKVLQDREAYPKAGTDDPYQQAMYITGMDGMTIEGNTIEDSWNDAIYVLASYFEGSTPDYPDGRRKYLNIHIGNNTIRSSECSGVHFDDYPSSGNTVIDNTILDSGGIPIVIEGDPSRVCVRDNVTATDPSEVS